MHATQGRHFQAETNPMIYFAYGPIRPHLIVSGSQVGIHLTDRDAGSLYGSATSMALRLKDPGACYTTNVGSIMLWY